MTTHVRGRSPSESSGAVARAARALRAAAMRCRKPIAAAALVALAVAAAAQGTSRRPSWILEETQGPVRVRSAESPGAVAVRTVAPPLVALRAGDELIVYEGGRARVRSGVGVREIAPDGQRAESVLAPAPAEPGSVDERIVSMLAMRQGAPREGTVSTDVAREPDPQLLAAEGAARHQGVLAAWVEVYPSARTQGLVLDDGDPATPPVPVPGSTGVHRVVGGAVGAQATELRLQRGDEVIERRALEPAPASAVEALAADQRAAASAMAGQAPADRARTEALLHMLHSLLPKAP